MTKRSVIITTSILVGIAMIFTILFGVVFRVRDISVRYEDDFCYKTQINEILSSSKLKKNTSIFSIDHKQIKHNIELNYPYAKAEVNISSFTSVKITLTNREPLYYIAQNERCFILDEQCKILEVISVQDYNAKGYKYILLDNVFNVSEDAFAGQFLSGKYVNLCNNLYNSLYSNAVLNIGEDVDNDGELDEKYLDRADMCDILTSIKFVQESELYGKVDKLVMTTSYGVKLTIIEPQKGLDNKVNMAFSALRQLIKNDKQNSTTLSTSGTINVDYRYDESGVASLICEYRND